MESMTAREQNRQAKATKEVHACLLALRHRLTPDEQNNEDIQVAMARLENWLAENDGRWVK